MKAEPRRLKFIVAYDGRPFAGWQSQANGNTVQDLLERAFARVAGAPVRVHGSGRTDAGVHALGQCAHADVLTRSLTAETWTAAVNAYLPPAIRVLRSAYASSAFHARFSATGKVYRYRIWNDRNLSPFEDGRAWHVPRPIEFAKVASEAQEFVGTHDFAGFAANRGKPVASTVRKVTAARVRKTGLCITLEFSGDGFLYKMVRLMVGALIRSGREDAQEVRSIRDRLRRPVSGPREPRPAAPANGLYLVRVLY